MPAITRSTFVLCALAAAAAAANLLQSSPNLCNPIDGSPPGSSVPGILQARTLECVAISFSTTVYMDHIFIHSSVDVFFQMGMFSNSSVQDPFLACVFSYATTIFYC